MIFRQELADFSAYTGLPFRVETITLEHLLAELSEAQQRAASLRAGEEQS